jgi:hypothetical protein
MSRASTGRHFPPPSATLHDFLQQKKSLTEFRNEVYALALSSVWCHGIGLAAVV